MWETLDFGIFCLPILFSYYQRSLSSCFGNNTTDVKTDKKKIVFDPISTQKFMWNSSLKKLIYFIAEPDPLSAFQIPLLQNYGYIYSTEEKTVSQILQYSYEYGNWKLFENRSQVDFSKSVYQGNFQSF